jgi:nitrite reductase/ring-hydroxylating ferredoxin subunit
MENVRVELAKCPKCGATCVVGLDEDFQVFCACCKTSFKIETVEVISDDEYKRRRKNAKEVFESNTWIAMKP